MFVGDIRILVAAGAILLASLWWSIRRYKSQRYDPPLPPGSLGFPFVGETLHLLRALKANNPGEFFEARVKKYGHIFKTSLFGKPVVYVSPPAGLKLMFYTHSKVLGSAWPSPMKTLVGEQSLFFMDGDKAKSFRHILMAFLGPEGIQRYIGRTSDIIQKHIEENWLPGGEVKAYDLIKKGLFSVVFDLFLSLSDEEEPELLGWFLDVVRALLELPINFPGTIFYKGKVARAKIFSKLDKFLARRKLELEQGRASATQDLLSVLLSTKDEDGNVMSDEEIKQNILMLILAGHDTSASSLAVSVKCIAENPDCYDEVRKENLTIAAAKSPGEPLNINDLRQMKYTWRAVQESIRFMPPATGSMRRALTDIEIDGYTIPQGWELVWSIHRSNKNKDFFHEPEKFDPERFNGPSLAPYSYTPFGGGPRICPGYELAKMQDCIFLHHLILKYNWSLVDPDETIQLAPLVAPVKGLPIKLTLA